MWREREVGGSHPGPAQAVQRWLEGRVGHGAHPLGPWNGYEKLDMKLLEKEGKRRTCSENEMTFLNGSRKESKTVEE